MMYSTNEITKIHTPGQRGNSGKDQQNIDRASDQRRSQEQRNEPVGIVPEMSPGIGAMWRRADDDQVAQIVQLLKSRDIHE